ncbi:hypothetical protein K466DRAFT_604916 [Polyporus arcularius HHB13444]|uniref:Uncharacterized protein n=1 Tax=Polyporus arcularius HHB13444 TaxID=1314778 RepID=A0A5C3NUD8_9APHY|nr:hypothetical protein K466DRAFT_604916 [Polyporus arcularius HHB13444]
MRSPIHTDAEYLSRAFVMRYDLERADGSAHEETITSLFRIAVASARHACLLALGKKTGRKAQYTAVQQELQLEVERLERDLAGALDCVDDEDMEASGSPYDDTYVQAYAPTQQLEDTSMHTGVSPETFVTDLIMLLKNPLVDMLLPVLLPTIEERVLANAAHSAHQDLKQHVSDAVDKAMPRALMQVQTRLEETMPSRLEAPVSSHLEKTLAVALVEPVSAAIKTPVINALIAPVSKALQQPVCGELLKSLPPHLTLDVKPLPMQTGARAAAPAPAKTTTVKSSSTRARSHLKRTRDDGSLRPAAGENQPAAKRSAIMPSTWRGGKLHM